MAIGAIVGFFGAIGYGAYIFFGALREYWSFVCQIFSGIEPRGEI
jgi:hypothetical protein